MAASFLSRLFQADILVDYEGLVGDLQPAEASQPRPSDGDKHPSLPKAVANRISVLTTDNGQLLKSPDSRLLADPPHFNYDRFVRERIPSDQKLKTMFPTDPGRRTIYRDVTTEQELLGIFIAWAEDTWIDCAVARKPRVGKFYQDLKKEIKIDNQEISAEYEVVTRSFSDLELWEHYNLSNDPDTGHTASLKQRLEAGENPFAFEAGGSEARKKYEYLLKEMRGPILDSLEAWETYHLDKDGGTTNIANQIHVNTLIFETAYFGGVQARQKYGWLYWVHLQLRTQKSGQYKSTSISGKLDPTDSQYLEARVLLGEDIFHSWYGAAARVKFGYLEDVLDRTPSHDLDTWEWFHVPEGSPKKAESELSRSMPIFDPSYYGGVEAREKWDCLASDNTRGEWDSPEDLRKRHNLRDIGISPKGPPRLPEST